MRRAEDTETGKAAHICIEKEMIRVIFIIKFNLR
jgi:hypothetical protein